MITELARVLRVITGSKSLIQCLAQGPAWQTYTICSSIWTILATIGLSNPVSVQWILLHVGLEDNTEADLEAKRGTPLPQSSAPMDFISACVAIIRHQQSVGDDKYLSDPHGRIHRVLAGSVNQFQRWQRDWTRDQCVTLAQLRTGHSPLLAGYLHRIGCRKPPPIHIAMTLIRQQSTWCYSV